MEANNNSNEFIELDDLRQQIIDLKNKVDKQGRLNEALIKKAVQGKMKDLHRNLLLYCLVVGVIVPFIIWNFIQSHFSWPFIIFSILMFAASFVAEYFINRMDVKHMTDDLVETARKLLQMKKNRKTQLAVGFGVIAVWIPWYLYEIYKSAIGQIDPSNIQYFMIFVVIGMIVGLIIGLLIGLSFYRKLQHSNDEMIDQINEFTREQ